MARAKESEVMMLLTANWREWYHFRHQQACFESGTKFEDYVSRVLGLFHDDFINPAPSGSLGDGGCDGLAESGTIFYACYGQRPGRFAERELANKIKSDFARGLAEWDTFHTWRFVTNAPVGPVALTAFTGLQQAHGASSQRPLTMRILKTEELWAVVVGTFAFAVLNDLFPGAPGVENIELADLLPLLDALGSADEEPDSIGAVLPVPADKMDYNALPEASRIEFNAGRLLAPRIDRWYEESADPNLSDKHGERFRKIYQEARGITSNPAEILERLYVSVAGPNFRMDGRRANAAFAVVSYFFVNGTYSRGPWIMLLPTKGVSSERALLTIGSEILVHLRGPMSVSALWEAFNRAQRAAARGTRVTFDWFSLALAALYALKLIDVTERGYLRRSIVS